MTARTLDAATLAARMTVRVLPADCDGGDWRPFDNKGYDQSCESCGKVPLVAVATDCGGGVIIACLPCADAECAS